MSRQPETNKTEVSKVLSILIKAERPRRLHLITAKHNDDIVVIAWLYWLKVSIIWGEDPIKYEERKTTRTLTEIIQGLRQKMNAEKFDSGGI